MTDAPVPVLRTFRDMIRRISPPWLQRGLGERLLYSIGVHADSFGDAVVAGVKQRFPGYYSYDSLPQLGRERRIYRGRVEGDASFAARLQGFLSSHQLRGGPYALLTQLYHYFAPAVFTIDLVYASGRRFTLDSAALLAGASIDEAIERSDIAWSPDGDTAKWARWWLFYYTDEWAVTPPTDAEIAELRFIPRAWNAAHPIGHLVLFPSGGELWGWPPGRFWGESGVWGTSGTPIYVDVEPV